MDRFISKEDFLKTPKEFQEDYIKWWKPQIGDFFTWTDDDNHEMRKVECCCSDLMVDVTAKNKGIDNRIPLPSIGSLIDYIEDKEDCSIKIGFSHVNSKDKINYFFILDYYNLPKKKIPNLGNDLLQACLKVACKIAEEDYNER